VLAKPDTARLFFAVWPEPGIQRALEKHARGLMRECGGRAIPARNIHLTLVFIGDVGRDRLPRIEEIAAAVSTPHFELAVSRVEYWRHNRIVWAGVEHCPGELQSLVDGIELALSAEGFRFDQRTYVPHITLVRSARRAPPGFVIPVITLPVSRFALVESVQRSRGRAYEVLQEWPLTA
jgi:2'-5' RNA ligase